MSDINIFITHQGVHKTIDQEIFGSNVAIPKSTLYQNISVPRWNNIIGADIQTIFSNLFYNDYKAEFKYNLGFFVDSAKGGNFKSLIELCPTGTKIWFVKNSYEDYNIVFQDWIKIMRSRGQEKVLRKKFRKDETFDDTDIQVEHEEKTVQVDDFADEYDASAWMPFDSNVYLNNEPAKSNTLEARLFVKPEGFAYKKSKEQSEDKDDEFEDDDFVNEEDL
jgi:hypothetical protein